MPYLNIKIKCAACAGSGCEKCYKGTVAKSVQYRGSADLSEPERAALEAIVRAIFAAVEKNPAFTDFFAATDIVVLGDSDSSY